jgi:two-component system, NarL family, response regulator DegU
VDQPITNEPKIRILIADGHALFREAIRAAMETEASFEVVALSGSGDDAIHLAETTRPEIAFLADGELSDIDGIEAARRIKAAAPECRIIILAAEADPQGLVDALEAGADGYLTKDCALSELIHAAKAVNSGDVLIPGWMLGGLLSRLMRRRKSQEDALRRVWELTRREREVLSLLAEGEDNEGIAEVLVISPQTARTHIQNILGKLGVHSRLEAAAFVAQNNVLEELTTNSQ